MRPVVDKPLVMDSRATVAGRPYLYFPRLYFLSDSGRSIAPKEETMNPQHQDEARERG